MKYLPLNAGIFVQNRERFISRMQKNSIAIFVSNDEVPSNGDALYHFKQNSDVFWLSGVTQEDSLVILFPDNPDPKYRDVLVLVLYALILPEFAVEPGVLRVLRAAGLRLAAACRQARERV
ncbi:MAG: aminopeptidase P N-terminal domain-containing protein, partial [Bacteroidota bacterium]